MNLLWAAVYVCSFWRSLDTMTAGLIVAAIADTWQERFALAVLAVTREIVT